MKSLYIIFLISLLLRLVYITFQGGNLEGKLMEDELLYWTWSLRGAYTGNSDLEEKELLERMPGAFFYYQLLLYITSKNINLVLYIQALIDSLTCLIIAKGVEKFSPKHYLKVYCFAAISPLMLIMASQTLAETLFLFLFSLFLLFSIHALYSRKIYTNLFFSGFFLGLTVFVKTITFPLIFLLLVPLFILFFIKKYKIINIILALLIFSVSAIAPISSRLKNNIEEYKTFSLTNQIGTHLAYWVTPAILCYTNNINREQAIEIVNREVMKKNITGNNSFTNSKVLIKTSFHILKDTNYIDLIYVWARASILNLLSPSILLDKRVRDLPHPSFYSISDPLDWLEKMFSDSKYHNYLMIIFIASLSSGKAEYVNGTRLVYAMDYKAMRFLNHIANRIFSILFTWLLGQRFTDTLCGTKVISKENYERAKKRNQDLGNFDPFGDFFLIFAASRLCLKISEVPIRYKARTYGKTQISRFSHGLLLVKMFIFAFFKLKAL